jgi:hypothetical protein
MHTPHLPRRLLFGRVAAWDQPRTGEFSQSGEVTWGDDLVRIGPGIPGSAIVYRGPMPTAWYRLEWEARRVAGSDFFCGMTFPVSDQFCSLILGGWGGGVTGFSCLDGLWAIENQTTGYTSFVLEQWYRLRLDVGPERLTAQLDDRTIASVPLGKHHLSVRGELLPALPLSISTWRTAGEVRGLQLIEL